MQGVQYRILLWRGHAPAVEDYVFVFLCPFSLPWLSGGRS